MVEYCYTHVLWAWVAYLRVSTNPEVDLPVQLRLFTPECRQDNVAVTSVQLPVELCRKSKTQEPQAITK